MANCTLEVSQEKCSDLERNLFQIQSELQDEQNTKYSLINEFNKQIISLQNNSSANMSHINELKQDLENAKALNKEKDQEIGNLKTQLADQKQNNEKTWNI
ncbi:hypothetical protein CEXT_241201 [Caerostris extrusa]|uniref:Uncharacterized protein n=1 Tax=Caerostris extrusa TaxID=172846 RepID=A0AAV4NA48_CAEEX|nr:hypothetical protein CEXT_241201 [Caerostris extrusa]